MLLTGTYSLEQARECITDSTRYAIHLLPRPPSEDEARGGGKEGGRSSLADIA
jgi:hypothetical protein